MAPGSLMCECGAAVAESVTWEAVDHEILAAEEPAPILGRWHTVVVCAYLLQHPSLGKPQFLDGQFRLLQLYRRQGLVALLRVAHHQRSRNRHSVRVGYDFTPLEPYAALPYREPPNRFTHGFQDLRELIGAFGRDDYREYERRLDAIVDATITAWLAPNVAEAHPKW